MTLFVFSKLGESEWNRLSDKERQRKIFQLKMRERQLRKAGKVDEANALIGMYASVQKYHCLCFPVNILELLFIYLQSVY